MEKFLERCKKMYEGSDDSREECKEEPCEGECKEEECKEERPAKKQKRATVLTMEETFKITKAAFFYYFDKNFDGDPSYVEGAWEFAEEVCPEADQFKAEHGQEFDVEAIVATFKMKKL